MIDDANGQVDRDDDQDELRDYVGDVLMLAIIIPLIVILWRHAVFS